jgi:hypothetical protein
MRGIVTLLGFASSASTGTGSSVLDGDVILTNNIYVLNSLVVGAAGFFDADYADKTRQPNIVTIAALSPYSVARQWGTAPFNVAQGSQIGLGQGLTAAASMLLTGGYKIDGATTAYSFAGGTYTSQTVSPANIDTFGALTNPLTGSRVFIRN